MPNPTPQWPTRADHRFLLKLTSLVLSGKVVPRPSEFDRVSRVFSQVGGSWERIYNGSADDINLLKKILKVAFKHGYLTKKEKWK